MRPPTDDFSDNDAAKASAKICHRLDLDATTRERSCAVFDGRHLVEVAELEEPTPEDLHD
jgi:hypothetical protein